MFFLFKFHSVYLRIQQASVVPGIGLSPHGRQTITGTGLLLKCRLTRIGIPIVEIRRSSDRLIATMG